MLIIKLSLCDAIFAHGKDLNIFRAMWLCTQKFYEPHTLPNSLAETRNFYSATMMVNENMLCYINRMQQLSMTI